MSSMGKPNRPTVDVRTKLMGHPKVISNRGGAEAMMGASTVTTTATASALAASPVIEFTCACATGWSGPTCEISEYPHTHTPHLLSLSLVTLNYNQNQLNFAHLDDTLRHMTTQNPVPISAPHFAAWCVSCANI